MEKNTKPENLTDKEKEAIRCRFERGMTYAEVGGELELSPKAAQVIIARAMEKLQTVAA